MKSIRWKLSRKSQIWRQQNNIFLPVIIIGMQESLFGISIPSVRQFIHSNLREEQHRLCGDGESKDIFTLPAEFGWSDLGSWGSLRTLLTQDENGNAKVGKDIRLYECTNCVVHAADESKVVVQGLNGYIVAEKHGQLLVCSLKEEQRIKEFGK